MRDGDDLDPRRSFTIDDQEGEAMEKVASPRAEYTLPTSGRLQNFIYCLIEF